MFARMRSILKALLSIAVIAAIAGGGWYYATHRGDGTEPTLTVERQDYVEKVTISGTVFASTYVSLGFAQNGRVQNVFVHVGDTVATGTVLASIENGDAIESVKEKQAALESAQAKLSSLVSGTRAEQLAIDERAVADDQTALADALHTAYITADTAVHKNADQFISNARTDVPQLSVISPDYALTSQFLLERTRLEPVLAALSTETDGASAKQELTQISTFLDDASALLAKTVLSDSLSEATLSGYRVDISTARSNVSAALSGITSALAALASAQGALALAQAGSSSEDITAQRALVKSAQATLANSEATLAKNLIVAPFAGIIATVDLKPGETVTASGPNISLISQNTFQVETYIPEVSIMQVELGDTATTTLDAYGDAVSFPGMVVSIDPGETIRDGVTTYKTVLVLTTTDPHIRSGMTANVTIKTGERLNALIIPKGAVFDINGQTMVRVDQEGTPVERAVTVVSTASLGEVEVASGLESGEIVYLSAPSP